MKFLARLLALLALLSANPALTQVTGPRAATLSRSSAGSLITSINADGWSATTQAIARLTFQPDTAPQSVTATEAGFDTSGNVTSYARSLVITKQVRFPYPSQATLNPSRVALSDYVWTTTSIAGVTNNSTLTAPKPIMQWVHGGDRRIIYNNSIHVEFVAAAISARAGKQIAYASCSATDGSLTVTIPAVAAPILTSSTDQQPVIGYYCDLDTSTLAAGQITVNAKAYPWYGNAASIADSSMGTAGTRGWVPQIFTKSTGSRYYANAASGGNDTSCVASTTAATALATPCATYVGAVNKCKTTAGDTGNCTIRLGAGAYVVATATTASATTSEMIVEPDPAASAGSVVLQFGAASAALNVKYLRVRNISLSRQGLNTLRVSAGGQIALENIAFDNGSYSGVAFQADGGVFVNGLTVTNDQNATLSQLTTTQNVMLLRGVSNSFSSTNKQIAPSAIVGSKFYNATIGYGANTQYGDVFIGFTKSLMNGQSATDAFVIGSSSAAQTATLSNIAIIQSVFEWSGNVAQPMIGLSRDPPIYTSLSNVVVDYITMAGAFSAGRMNAFYDNNVNTSVRTHAPVVIRNSILSQLNTKGDMYVATNGADPTDAPLHVGGWAPYYGVGFKNNWYSYADAGSHWADGSYTSDFSQLYAGLNARIGTSTTVGLDPGFTSYQAVTYNGSAYTAGAGNSDLTLQVGGAGRGRVAEATLPANLAGVARPSTGDSVGAY